MLQWRELGAEERAAYYTEKLSRDFPPAELKPLSTIERMCEKGAYHCYAFFDGADEVGYAWLVTEGCFTLLDYLAMEPSCRGKGYGSQILPIITGELIPDGNTLLIEAENPACAASLDDREVRLARLRFYKKGGMRLTEVLGKAFGVEYRIFAGGAERPDKAVADGLDAVYAAILPETVYKQNVRIWMP